MMILDSHALDRPLLVNMADPTLPFMVAMGAFKQRMLLVGSCHGLVQRCFVMESTCSFSNKYHQPCF